MTKSTEIKTRSQRVSDLYALMGRHRISLVDVCKEAGLIDKYDSIRLALSQVDRFGNEGAISDERLATVEDAAIRLRENLQTKSA